MDSHPSSLDFLCLFGISEASSVLCFVRDKDTIILLPFMAIPSMITILALNDQYCCISFCTSAFGHDQLHNTYSDSMPKCSFSMATNFMSPFVM